MHETFCFRNIIKCEHCKKPIDKNKKQEHFEEFHEKIKCECGDHVEKDKLAAHKSDTCRKRQTQCYYCDLSLDSDKFQDHLNFCGSRTEKCEKCDKYIQIKDRIAHESANCAYPPTKPVANKVNPGLTVFNTNERLSARSNHIRQAKTSNSADLIPCEFCFETFPIDELITHQSNCNQNRTDSPDIHLNNYGQLNSNLGHLNLGNRNTNSIPNDFFVEDDRENSFEQEFYSNNQRSNFNNANRFDDNDYNDRIPCEFCNELYDMESIIVHQSACDKAFNSLDEIRRQSEPLMNIYGNSRGAESRPISKPPSTQPKTSISKATNPTQNPFAKLQEPTRTSSTGRASKELVDHFKPLSSLSVNSNKTTHMPSISRPVIPFASNPSSTNPSYKPLSSLSTNSTTSSNIDMALICQLLLLTLLML